MRNSFGECYNWVKKYNIKKGVGCAYSGDLRLGGSFQIGAERYRNEIQNAGGHSLSPGCLYSQLFSANVVPRLSGCRDLTLLPP